MQSNIAVQLLREAMLIPVLTAVIALSRSTRVAIGIARSVRLTRAISGWRPGEPPSNTIDCTLLNLIGEEQLLPPCA